MKGLHLLKRIKHWCIALFYALLNIRSLLKTKPKIAPTEVAMKRLDTCINCPRLDIVVNQCLECYCFIGFKVRFLDEKCPLGKWENS